jgi:hypothetical protein
MIKDWLRRVKLVPDLMTIRLSDTDRTRHLPKLFDDLICRLHLGKDANRSISAATAMHGQKRRQQGHSDAMLVEESRVVEVSIFSTLHLHYSELDAYRTIGDVIVIADEVDAQLAEAVWPGTKLVQSAAWPGTFSISVRVPRDSN